MEPSLPKHTCFSPTLLGLEVSIRPLHDVSQRGEAVREPRFLAAAGPARRADPVLLRGGHDLAALRGLSGGGRGGGEFNVSLSSRGLPLCFFCFNSGSPS